MAVFPLFAPFRIYKNIHTQNFADNYLMLMPSDLRPLFMGGPNLRLVA